MAQNPERTIKEMTSLDLNQQPLCIEYPTLDVDFELKSGLIRLLPTFRGLAGLSEANRSLVDAASGGALGFPTSQAYGICTSPGHFTDACPTLQEEPTEHANAIGGFFGQQRRYDPFSNTYNLGWRDHSNLRYGNASQNFQKPPPPLQSNHNSGEEFENSPKQVEKSNQFGEEHPKVFVPKPPFPERFAKSKKEEGKKEILEILRKVEVNIPLLDAIKQVPRYAKFLKEMCINKSKLRGNERVSMGENVSTILQSKLPPKYKDSDTFSIPCKIENIGIENARCDLGASINVMSLAIYESLNIGPLKETGVVLQLADRSIVYP
ncbi:UNVERIFIED_CONTAM: hypothetical protein Slati_3542500 [Sesamum latifolium]|uniref:Retrotransposon gag protein n=1 Tax=Sesamum latifolium TaxID=2727402 RepID=A0AAW2UM23_9LAMI